MKTSTSHVARTIVAVTVIATGAGLHAQNSTTAKQDESNVTVTGCLQPAVDDRAAVGTSGTRAGDSRADAKSDARAFMLVNARVGAAPGGGSGVTSIAPAGSGTNESAVRAGQVPPSPAIKGAMDKNGNTTGSGGMYALTGDNPELPRHAGQEVEISGRLITSTAPSASSGTSTTAGHMPQASAPRMPQLEVKTIRMIASVCAAR